MITKTLFLIGLVILSTLLLPNCASTGTSARGMAYSAAPIPHGGRSMILVYRTPGLMGMAMKPTIWVNSVKLTGALARGSFVSYEAAPGPVKVEFAWRDKNLSAGQLMATGVMTGGVGLLTEGALNPSMQKKQVTNLTAHPGQTHYVLMDGYKVEEVSAADAQDDMAKCQWLNPPGR